MESRRFHRAFFDSASAPKKDPFQGRSRVSASTAGALFSPDSPDGKVCAGSDRHGLRFAPDLRHRMGSLPAAMASICSTEATCRGPSGTDIADTRSRAHAGWVPA